MSFIFSVFDRQKTVRSQRSGANGDGAIAEFSDLMAFAGPAAGPDGIGGFGGGAGAFGFGPMAAAVTIKTVAAATKTTIATVAAAATKASTVSATTSKLPTWVSSIKTTSIKTDVSAAVADGTVSYAELVKVFGNLASSLTTSKSTLSATQFADLKTFAASLTSGVTTSSYLTSVTNALVNGSKANATWTGGAATAVTLGNLAAGSSATTLNRLVGKWFLGTDLPSSKVSMSGTSTFTVSYKSVAKPLFSASGPVMNDVNQGYLGDCYLLAGLSVVADQNASAIKSMFTDNGNGTYGVRFYVNGAATFVTVDTNLANGGTIFNYCGSNLWASLAEKAYAQLQASGVITGNIYNYGNSWSTIGNGGAPEYALAQITGASQITDFCAAKGSWTCNVYNASMKWVGGSSGLSNASVLSTLIARIAAGDSVVLSSYTNAKDASGKTTLVSGHAMSIYGYNAATGNLQIRNPWGSANGQTWATTFEASLATLLAAGDVISVDNSRSGVMANVKTASATTTSTVRSFLDDELGALSASSIDVGAALFAQSMATMPGDTAATTALVASLAATPTLQLVSPLG